MKNVMFKKMSFAMMIMALALFTGASVYAASEDEGLYDAVPPENSAFIRFIHAQADLTSEIPPKVNGRDRDGIRFGGVKPYSVIAPGKVLVELGPGKKEFEAEPKGHYTVILQANDLRIEKDPEPTSDLKAHIIVYNLTTHDDIIVKTADGKINVVGPIPANTVMDKEVNPIKISFKVYKGDEEFATLIDWPLERKQNYVIAIVENDDGGLATYDRARTSNE